MGALRKIQGEFQSRELAELALWRIRRSVQGVHHTTISSRRIPEQIAGKEQYTILPANPRMQNYATAVMISEVSDDIFPEPMYRRSAGLMILCEEKNTRNICAIMQSLGAVNLRISQ